MKKDIEILKIGLSHGSNHSTEEMIAEATKVLSRIFSVDIKNNPPKTNKEKVDINLTTK